jgi:uncharacterized protein YkwD
MLAACGGGGSDSASSAAPDKLQQEANAPIFTSNTAQDGFNWTNFRRQQAGIGLLTRNSIIDVAAQGHSDYQRLNNTITHDQIAGRNGFTGATLLDRLRVAGYSFGGSGGIVGEVIAAANDSSGFFLAEELVTAIYHRFVMFEPAFSESGAGAATALNGRTYFTNDLATKGVGLGLGLGQIAVYPFAGQSQVATVFFSDQEDPDPVPDQNAVGYPISVHADYNRNPTLVVTSFTVRARGGADLAVRLLTRETDPNTAASGPSAAAIIPLAVLVSGTTYDVAFVGSVNNLPISKNWSFTTK